MRPPRTAWLLLEFWLLAACSAGPGEVRTAPSKVGPAGTGLPVLALAPGESAYFVAVWRLSSLSNGIRTFWETLRALEQNLTAERADQELRKELGASPLQSLEIEDAGLDPGADAALFSTGVSPTFAFKIGDERKLTSFLAERTKNLTTYVRSHRGVAVTSWNSSPEVRGSFFKWRGYLLVHLELVAPAAAPGAAGGAGRPDKPEVDLRWLDDILGAAQEGRGPRALPWALAAAGGRRDLVLFVNPLRVARAAALVARNRDRGCADGDQQLGRIQRLGLGLTFAARALRARLQVELGEEAARELHGQLSDGPRLPASLWEGAPARLEWQIDPLAVSAWLKRVAQPRCGALQTMLAELRGLADPIEKYRSALEHAGRSVSAALLASDEKGQGTLLLRGAILSRAPAASARAYLERQLTLAPGEVKVAGRPVRRIEPTLALAETAYLAVADGLLRLSAGEGVMEKLMGAQRRERRGSGLLRFELVPGKLADLRAAFKLLDDSPGPAPAALPPWFPRRRSRNEELDQTAAWLASFARLGLEASLSGNSLRIEGDYALR